MKKVHFFLLLFWTFSLPGLSQPVSHFLLYGVKDGLSQNSVHAVFRDRDGIVWIGTQDGLNCFDGKHFTVYRHSDEDSTTISDQFVLSITEDKAGTIWIGTRNGLNALNKHTGKFRRYYIDPEEQHQFQSTYAEIFLTEDKNIAVIQNGLFIIDPLSGMAQAITDNRYPKTNWLTITGNKGWLVNENYHLLFADDIHQARFRDLGDLFSSPSGYTAIRAEALGDSLLFIYDRDNADKILIYDTRTFALKHTVSVPFRFSGIKIYSQNDIYIYSAKGIYRMDIAGNIEPILTAESDNGSLPPGTILTVYKDAGDDLWIGTSGNGVAVSNPSFNNFRLLRSPGETDVITAVTRASNVLYVGTRNGLFRAIDPNKNNAKNYQPILSGKIITALATDRRQNIWACISGEGIAIFSPKGNIIRKISPGPSPAENNIMHLLCDSKGRMLIGTTKGFFVADPESDHLISFTEKDSIHTLRGNYIISSFEDSDGNIWISSNNGLDVFTGSLQPKLHFQSTDDKLSFIKRTIVTSVAQNNKGAIWIGTIRNGVYKYDQGKISHYTTASGLASDVVYNVLCDGKGRLWATTSAGLCIFNDAQNAFTTLTLLDGVPAVEFILGAVHKEGDNFFYGTSDGLLICNAPQVQLHETGAKAYFSDIKINGKSITPENGLIKLVPDDKLISFELASSPAFFTGDMIYQYRLVGQNEEWITVPLGVHTVSYTGLPYKTLSMQVRCAVSQNNLAAAPVYSITIKSRPPFWKTTAFIILIVLALLSVIALSIIGYKRKNYKKQLQQLQMEKSLQVERVRIGRDLHDNIGAYTSALIAGLSRLKPNNKTEVQDVEDLKEYGGNIMGFLRETIWMLNAEKLTVTAFADRFKNYTLRIAKNYPGIDFIFKEKDLLERTLSPSVMLNIFRVMQEALQNACKHAGASEITITVNNTDLLYFEIADNGSGFNIEEKDGHYGLSNMKARAKETGFMLTISTDVNGTAVKIAETKNTANAALQQDS